jgi:ribosomal protein S18 acetylase RimI-like enzyme
VSAAATATNVRRMRGEDAAAAAAVHVRAFPGFFLTSLGERFLRVFYRACADFTGGVALVAESGGSVVGFVVGAADHEAFHRSMRRRWILALGLAAVPAIIAKPAIVWRFVRALLSRGPQMPAAAGALLMSIAVDPAAGQRGAGRQLVGAFGEEMRRLGCREYRLTTDRDNNERVNAFYAAAGMVLETAHQTAQGRWMNRYVCSLDGAAARAAVDERIGHGSSHRLVRVGG